jgi:hypothetical protein
LIDHRSILYLRGRRAIADVDRSWPVGLWPGFARLRATSTESLDGCPLSFSYGAASKMLRALALASVATIAAAHNSLMIPVPRNAADGAPGVYPGSSEGKAPPGGLTCTCADSEACDLGDARKVGGAGQGCLWWSQGCSIGCDYCLTDPKHPDNKGKIPTKAITGNAPHDDKAGFRKSYCAAPKTKSVLPKEYWTMNIHAVEGAVNDSYRFNPWRAPGSAPVIDPCES